MIYVWYDKSVILQSQTQQTARDRVATINTIIDGLLAAQIAIAVDPTKQEYSLDDGQTKIRVVYKDLAAVASAIIVWERTKQMYLNQYNGRMSRLVPSVAMPQYNLFNLP